MNQLITRRRALGYGGAAGALVAGAGTLPQIVRGLGAAPAEAASSCAVLTPDLTEGPYWVDLDLHRSAVTANTANATSNAGTAQAGVPLTLTINVVDASNSCAPYNNCYVDIWHANAYGIYSDEASQQSGGGDTTAMETTTGQNFLRGYQITGADPIGSGAAVDGQAQFQTIWPGWYTSRAIHIHVRVRTYSGTTTVTNYTTQIFFTDAANDVVLDGAAPYNTRTTIEDPTTDENDTVLQSADDATNIVAVTGSIAAGFAATFTITIDEGAVDSEGSGTAPGTTTTTTTTGSTTTGVSGTTTTAATLDASLAKLKTQRGSHGARTTTAMLTVPDTVTVGAEIIRGGKRLAAATGHLTKGTHAMKITIPKSVPAGTATLYLALADSAGARKVITHQIHIPSRG